MHWIRTTTAMAPASQPKGRATAVAAAPERSAADDLRLFATTFAAGFLFVTLIIA